MEVMYFQFIAIAGSKKLFQIPFAYGVYCSGTAFVAL